MIEFAFGFVTCAFLAMTLAAREYKIMSKLLNRSLALEDMRAEIDADIEARRP